MERWDRDAIRAGALVSLVFAVPFSVGASIAGSGNSGLATALVLGAVAGFVVGAGCAAWLQRRGTPLSHGMVTAGGTYLVAQAVFVTIELIRSESVNWLALLFNLSVVLVAGIIGGLLGQKLQSSGFEPTRRR